MINVLPENLINQIAAGEVIERPYSCVKELVENSIDAEAQNICVEIENGGKTYIKVSDDGCGMDKKDARACFARHATSKITSQDDLSRITTMGFRGEAIPSIASVSAVTLQTRKRGEFIGTLIVCEGGKIVKYQECGTKEGTQFEVKNLFYNTPARQKYLKADSTEFQHMVSIMTSFALSHPWISFKLIHNGKSILDLPGGQSPLDRVRYVLGREVAENVMPVFAGGISLKIEGHIGKPSIARATRDYQYLFINRRDVKNPALAFAVKECFKSLIPANQYPLFVLNIEIDPTQVDVNVHPRKTEVRFVNQSEIFKKLQNAVYEVFKKYSLAPRITFAENVPRAASPSDIQNAIKFTEEISAAAVMRDHQPLTKRDDISIIPIAQVANSYIIAQSEEGLTLIDQHAAHERVMYERLLSEFTEKSCVTSQPLLLPTTLELSHKEVQILNDNLEVFKTLGFDIESFSGNTISIDAVPNEIANKEDIATLVRGLIDDIVNSKKPSNMQGRIEQMLHFMACRSAVKFGQRLTYDEQVQLIYDLEKTERKFTCPHGRPTMIELTFDELDKRFGRK